VHADGGATFDVKNTADGITIVAKVANGAGPDIHARVGAAHSGVPRVVGTRTRPRTRAGASSSRSQELMQERTRRRSTARLVTLENGKPYEDAKKEASVLARLIRLVAEELGG